MKRYAVLLTASLFLAGCQGQMPAMNWLPPYGHTRVPPPPTGSYGQPDAYYQPSTQPGVPPGTSQGSRIRGSSRGLSLHEGNDRRLASTPEDLDAKADDVGGDRPQRNRSRSRDRREPSSIQMASADRQMGPEPPLRIVESRGRGESESTPFKGMPLNDATLAGEPRRFDPPKRMVDISQLPRPARTIQPPRNVRTVSRDVPSRAHTTSSTSSPDGWRTRKDSGPEIRVAGR